MANGTCRTICWIPTWNSSREGIGLEHLLLTQNKADSVVLAIDDKRGPFRLVYRLYWNEEWQLRSAEFSVATNGSSASLSLKTDGHGHWQDGQGHRLVELDECMDIDIWPTPFTNSFPIRRQPMSLGERCLFRMAWVFGSDLTVRPQPQAYTRVAEKLYLFENLDGSSFQAELQVDEDNIVLDSPELFRRVKA